MYLIQQITDVAKQTHPIILLNGKEVTIDLEFKDLQSGWFISLVYEDVTIKNLRVVSNPNILHQYRHLLPFGIACFTDSNQEPLFVQDFSSSRSKLYIITQAEMDEYEAFLSG